MSNRKKKRKDIYRGAIITALPVELAAVRAMLDEEHSKPIDFQQRDGDSNVYLWGSLGQQNVVLTSLPAGVYGTTSATATVLPLKYAFPDVKWGLMVGIAAGIPSETRDIRLGDVVVSQPHGSYSGVFQYDFGKSMSNDVWQRLDWFPRPPDILLSALANIQSEHELYGTWKLQQYLHDASVNNPFWAKAYGYPADAVDRLFLASYSHQPQSQDCTLCDGQEIVQRKERRPIHGFNVHYGLVGSGNSLVKDARIRDHIASMVDQCICIEMEAAGLMNGLPSLVIRGISDYADSHKNDRWQRYACAKAAAFAKGLLSLMSATDEEDAYVPINKKSLSTDSKHTNSPRMPVLFSKELHPPQRRPSPELDKLYPMPAGPFSSNYADSTSNHASFSAEQDSSDRHVVFEPLEHLEQKNMDQKLDQPSEGKAHLSTIQIKQPESKENVDNSPQPQTIYEIDRTPLDSATRQLLLSKVKFKLHGSGDVNKSIDEQGNRLIHYAAKEGDHDMVKFLIDQKAEIAALNSSGESPIGCAAAVGDLGIVALLLDQYGNDDVTPIWTVLEQAARNGHVGIINFLFKKYPSFKFKYNINKALHAAFQTDQVEVASLLLGQYPTMTLKKFETERAITNAASSGHMQMVSLLVDWEDNNVKTISYNRENALRHAAYYGHTEVVKMLLDRNTIIESQDKDGNGTALDHACANGHIEITKLLLDRGAKIDTRVGKALCDKVKYIRSALFAAVSSDKAEMVELLQVYGAEIESKNSVGDTPLLSAVTQGRSKAVKALLVHNANTEAEGNFGNTSLLVAVKAKCRTTIKLLLAHQADIEAKDERGMTPLLTAIEAKDEKTVRVLLAHKANIEAQGEGGITPLQAATKADGEAMVRLLLAHKANIEATDFFGKTPLHYAAENHHKNIAELLLAHHANIEAMNKYRNTPLIRAVAHGGDKTEMIELLLAHGANVLTKDGKGRPILKLADDKNLPKTTVVLRRAGALGPPW